MLFSAPFYPAESAKYHPCHLDITLPTVNIPCKMAGRPYWQPETVTTDSTRLRHEKGDGDMPREESMYRQNNVYTSKLKVGRDKGMI